LQLERLDHAGAGDEEKGLLEANLEAAQFHQLFPPAAAEATVGAASAAKLFPGAFAPEGAPTVGFAAALWARAAAMKPRNSGWPSRGVERTSGCAWQAMNHGCPGSSTISTSRSAMDLALMARPASSSWV